MKIVVTGSTGLVGSHLVPHLRGSGHQVRRLVRRAPRAADEVRWDPSAGTLDAHELAGTDAIVHLAGAGVGDHRWTADYKRTILRSRVDGTRLVSRTAAALDPPPRVLISASGIDHYPSTDAEVTEAEPRGNGQFLGQVTRAWEGATAAAQDAGITVSQIRSGLVLAQRGGMMTRLRPLVLAGLAGPIGSGRAWWSWITLPDHVRAVTRLLDGDLPGPVNLTAPHPAQQREVMRALATAARRPAVLPVPEAVVRLVIGQFAEAVVASHRVRPVRLLESGFTFEHGDLTSAARWVMA